MFENRIHFTLTEDQKNQLDAAISTMASILGPFAVNLSDNERMTLPKIAETNLGFVRKVGDYLVSQPEFKPNYVNAAEFKVDLAGFELARGYENRLGPVFQILSNISLLSGSEAYSASLAYYRSAGSAARDGIVGAKPVHDDLRVRFENQGTTSTPAVKPPTPAS